MTFQIREGGESVLSVIPEPFTCFRACLGYARGPYLTAFFLCAPRAKLQEHKNKSPVDDHNLCDQRIDQGLGVLGLKVEAKIVVEKRCNKCKEQYGSRAEQFAAVLTEEVQDR